MNSKEFQGIFKNEFENFIIYKQSLGFYRNLNEKKIYEFLALNRFLDSLNLNEIKITQETAELYLKQYAGLSQSTVHHYECIFRQFCKFLRNQGYQDIYVSYDSQIKMPRDFIPYVFSNDEIKMIFKTIDNLTFKVKPETVLFYQTLFRLLYCTGLRLGEALNLKVEDVDLVNNIIKVISGKGNVSRLVPFKSSLNKWLSEYQQSFYKDTDTYFFESPKGGKRSNNTISSLFKKKILPDSGIKTLPQTNHKREACVYSLRHTFACNAMDQMTKQGKDPYCALPYLSTYLGHTSIVNTEIYLRLTLQRYEEVIDCGHYIYEESIGENHE